jgi:hypothetical protein
VTLVEVVNRQWQWQAEQRSGERKRRATSPSVGDSGEGIRVIGQLEVVGGARGRGKS